MRAPRTGRAARRIFAVMTTRTAVAGLAALLLAAGCGSDEDNSRPADPAASVRDARVLLTDAFDDNAARWLAVPKLVYMKGGEYVWLETPEGGGDSLPDTELDLDMPPGVTASIDVEMTAGAALRGLTCREAEMEDAGDRSDWYELGIDGRRALIRRMASAAPPEVLASADLPVANAQRVRLTARCVPDGERLLLTLSVDGDEVVRAYDDEPVSGEPGTVAVFGYARPDSDGPANMIWDDFELREATLAPA